MQFPTQSQGEMSMWNSLFVWRRWRIHGPGQQEGVQSKPLPTHLFHPHRQSWRRSKIAFLRWLSSSDCPEAPHLKARNHLCLSAFGFGGWTDNCLKVSGTMSVVKLAVTWKAWDSTRPGKWRYQFLCMIIWPSFLYFIVLVGRVNVVNPGPFGAVFIVR